MKTIQKGFTLIELMIVVAIIGILAAIAIPAYQDYTIRAQVTEGATLAGNVKAAMADFYAQNGTWPTQMTGVAAGSLNFTGVVSGQYVSTITTAGNGIISIAFAQTRTNLNLRPQVLQIYAALNPNLDPVWICGKQALPAGATSVGGAAGGTTVTTKYLPRNCQI